MKQILMLNILKNHEVCLPVFLVIVRFLQSMEKKQEFKTHNYIDVEIELANSTSRGHQEFQDRLWILRIITSMIQVVQDWDIEARLQAFLLASNYFTSRNSRYIGFVGEEPRVENFIELVMRLNHFYEIHVDQDDETREIFLNEYQQDLFCWINYQARELIDNDPELDVDMENKSVDLLFNCVKTEEESTTTKINELINLCLLLRNFCDITESGSSEFRMSLQMIRAYYNRLDSD